MKRIVHKSYSFKEAQRWDIRQQVSMSHEQRQKAAKDLRHRVFGKNVQNLYRALKTFWHGSIPGLQSAQELLSPGVIIQFGVPPNRIDLVSSITGVPFRDAWSSRSREEVKIKKRVCSVFFIGLDQLIKNKEARGTRFIIERVADIDRMQRCV